jgi:hypothetical protein
LIEDVAELMQDDLEHGSTPPLFGQPIKVDPLAGFGLAEPAVAWIVFLIDRTSQELERAEKVSEDRAGARQRKTAATFSVPPNGIVYGVAQPSIDRKESILDDSKRIESPLPHLAICLIYAEPYAVSLFNPPDLSGDDLLVSWWTRCTTRIIVQEVKH